MKDVGVFIQELVRTAEDSATKFKDDDPRRAYYEGQANASEQIFRYLAQFQAYTGHYASNKDEK